MDPILESFSDYEKPVIKNEIQEEIVSYSEKANEGYEFFNHLTLIGQLKDSYILCENEEGLVIIDQHAAQERYHYEQLLEKLNQPVIATQPLMVPLVLNVSANVLSLVDSINEKIASFGLSFEVFGNDRLIVREIPLWFQDVHQEDFFYDLVEFFFQYHNVNKV